MVPYIKLLSDILTNGWDRPDRTGVGSRFLSGAHLSFDMVDGFPAVTTKPLAFKAVVGEMIGFLRGYDSADKFRSLNCKVWDDNANKDGTRPNKWLDSPYRKGTDDLGRIYGVQWRDWLGSGEFGKDNAIDQVWKVIQSIRNTPNDRRMIVNAWRPDEFDQMALPPCHVLHHYLVDTQNNKLHMNMFQRSCDVILGIPFNIAQYALLLHIMAKLTGYQPGLLGMFLSDVHIYHNHLQAAEEQIQRLPRQLPTLEIEGALVESAPWELVDFYGTDVFSHIYPDDFSIINYERHPALVNPTPMNV